MKDYQNRVIIEKTALGNQIIKLTNFLFSDLSTNLTERDRNLMQEQLNIMIQYSLILARRIENFV